jgi:hypothetical protein
MSTFSKLLRGAALAAALVAIACLTGSGACAQESSQAAAFTAADYVGTWHWMFQGKAFATMTLQQNGGQLTGSLTGVSIEMDNQGKLTKAVATNGPSTTLNVFLKSGVLHVAEKDGDDDIEWTMTLTSSKTGELRFAGGAPANIEPIRLEKLWSEPPVQP